MWEITSESELKEVWNMKKKIICLMTSVILCLSLLTGCQLGSRTTAPEEEGPVTVYAVDMSLPENVENLRAQRDYELTATITVWTAAVK